MYSPAMIAGQRVPLLATWPWQLVSKFGENSMQMARGVMLVALATWGAIPALAAEPPTKVKVEFRQGNCVLFP